jgi:hypothetical protein
VSEINHLPYDQFRTGFTFADVRLMLWSFSDDSRDWHPGVSRRTVLGKWREIKINMYDRYVYESGRVAVSS